MPTPQEINNLTIDSESYRPDKAAPPTWLFAISLPVAISYFIWMGCISIYLSEEWMEKSTYNGLPLSLIDGWLFNRKIDLTDSQWKMFRSFLPLLAVIAVIFTAASRVVKDNLCKRSKAPLLSFYVITSLGFMCYLYGLALIFPILVIIFNYYIGKICGASKWNTMLTWGFNLFILFSSKYFEGYKFHHILGDSYHAWDMQYRGVLSWEVYFNLIFCRLISFNMDYRDSCVVKHLREINQHKEIEIKPEWDENRQRMSLQLDADHEYGMLPYLAYVLYIPLYIAGPIITYTAFYSYVMQKPQQEFSRVDKMIATIKMLAYLFALEVGLHYIYCPGFTDKGLWKDEPGATIYYSTMEPLTPAMVVTTGFATLLYMYMKFLIIWRLFRVWALWDDVNPPENMPRCIINNHTISGFWRNWHSSLNVWIVKYIYVPMGGSKNKSLSIWIIFAFIALWHDLLWRWMAWAMMNCLLFVGEIIVNDILAKSPNIQRIKAISDNQFKPFYNLVTVGSSIFTMVGLIFANLAIMHGFGDSYKFIVRVYWNKDGPFLVLAGIVLMFAIAQVVLWIKERERKLRLK